MEMRESFCLACGCIHSAFISNVKVTAQFLPNFSQQEKRIRKPFCFYKLCGSKSSKSVLLVWPWFTHFS